MSTTTKRKKKKSTQHRRYGQKKKKTCKQRQQRPYRPRRTGGKSRSRVPKREFALYTSHRTGKAIPDVSLVQQRNKNGILGTIMDYPNSFGAIDSSLRVDTAAGTPHYAIEKDFLIIEGNKDNTTLHSLFDRDHDYYE